MNRDVTIKRTLSPLLYILQHFNGKLTKHKLFKILYFADMEHISQYGRKITDDTYYAMQWGPVPTELFDMVKKVEGKYSFPVDECELSLLKSYISVVGKTVYSIKDADPKFLSKSETASLDSSIQTYGSKSFTALCDLSHGSAWKSAGLNFPISDLEIAKEAGANAEMLHYINVAN